KSTELMSNRMDITNICTRKCFNLLNSLLFACFFSLQYSFHSYMLRIVFLKLIGSLQHSIVLFPSYYFCQCMLLYLVLMRPCLFQLLYVEVVLRLAMDLRQRHAE